VKTLSFAGRREYFFAAKKERDLKVASVWSNQQGVSIQCGQQYHAEAVHALAGPRSFKLKRLRQFVPFSFDDFSIFMGYRNSNA